MVPTALELALRWTANYFAVETEARGVRGRKDASFCQRTRTRSKAAEPAPIANLSRWRDCGSLAATAERGSKVSEDTTVPRDRLAEAIEETLAIERRHELSACCWGPAGDANLHSPTVVALANVEKHLRAERAAESLFELAVRRGESISSEHGGGVVERGLLPGQWCPGALVLDAEIKRAFDSSALLHSERKT